MVRVVQADGFGQLAHGQAAAQHGQALEEGDGLLEEDGDWAVAGRDHQQGVARFSP
jgi:hypothetical protein